MFKRLFWLIDRRRLRLRRLVLAHAVRARDRASATRPSGCRPTWPAPSGSSAPTCGPRSPRAARRCASARRSSAPSSELAAATAGRIREASPVGSSTRMDANELRRACHRLLRRARPRVVPSAGLIPHHPDRADVHQRRDDTSSSRTSSARSRRRPARGPRRSRSACGSAGKHNDIDEIGRTTPPPHASSRCSATGASATTSRTTPSRGRGSSSPRCSASTATASGSPCTTTDDEAEAIWRDAVGFPARAHPAPGQGQLLGDGRDRPVRAVLGDLLRLRPRVRAPTAGPATRRRATATSSSGTSCSCSTYRQRRRQPRRPAQAATSTPAPASSASSRCSRASDSVFDTDVLRPLVDAAESVTGRRYGDDDETDVAPADPGRPRPHDDVPRQRRRDPVERGPRLRAAPHHPPGRALRLPARRRAAGHARRWSTRSIDVMGEAYPELRAQRATSITACVAREEERFRRTLKPGSAILDDAELPGGGTIAGATSRSSCTTPTASRSSSPGRSRPSAASTSTSTASTRPWPSSAAGPARRRKAARGRPRPTSTPTARCSTQFGTTEFTGYAEYESKATVLAVVAATT